MKKTLLTVLVVAVLVGAGSFYGGMKYAQSNPPAGGPQRAARGNFQDGAANIGSFAGNRSGAAGGFASGDIIFKDDKSVTVKMRDGGSKIVFYSDATEVSKFVNGAAVDLTVGQTVTINGKTNEDGSITAQSVQIRPNFPSPSPTPSK